MVIDRAGNTRNRARTVHLASGSVVFKDQIGGRDPNDFLRLNLTGRSSVSLSLRGFKVDTNLQLLNGSGKVLQTAARRGKLPELINTTLNAGSYYIRLYPGGKNRSKPSKPTSYTLSVHTVPLNSPSSNPAPGPEPNPNPIPAPTPIPSAHITVTNPNGGNTLVPNTSYMLTWDDNLSEEMQIELYKSGSLVRTIVNSTPSSGSYEWNVPANVINGADYQIRISSVSNSNVDDYSDGNFSIQGDDWFDLNIQDFSLRSLSRSRFSDGLLDRNDTIAILQDAKDSNTIDGFELTDLRHLISDRTYILMPEYVRVLANKVVNNNVANAYYRGTTLGDLQVGNSATKLDQLIDKWFYGGDRPATPYSYQYANGSLFQNGISYEDISQGDVGDCYFLAGLGGIALRLPNVIQSMFIDNGDNTFTVRFYRNGAADYVTVDRYLPVESSGRFAYAKSGTSSYSNALNELWVALAEKAYAQLNEAAWIDQDNTNSYSGIDAGFQSDAVKHVANRDTTYSSGLDKAIAINAFNVGSMVAFGTKEAIDITLKEVVPNHVYVMVGYNPATQKVKLFNPWGVNGAYYDWNSNGQFENNEHIPGFLELTWNQITENFVEAIVQPIV